MSTSITIIVAYLRGVVDWTSVSKAIETFLSAPAGQLLLLIVFVSICLWGFYALRRLEISNARNQREADLEKARLQNQESEDVRRAQLDGRIATALDKYADGARKSAENEERLLSIIQRMEPRQATNTDLLREAKTIVESTSARLTTVHQDLRKGVGAMVTKLDNANAESRTLADNTQQVINNRAQETQKTVHSVANDIQTSIAKHDTSQSTLFDQMMDRLKEVLKEVSGLRNDLHTAKEDNRLATIETLLRETLAAFASAKKDTGRLNPETIKPLDPLVIPTLPPDIRTTQTLATVPPPTVEMPRLNGDIPDAT